MCLSSNLAVNTDALRRPPAAPAPGASRRLLLRYAATSEAGFRASIGRRAGSHAAPPSSLLAPRQRGLSAPTEHHLLEAVPFGRVGKPRRQSQLLVQASRATLQSQALSVGAAMNLFGNQGGSYRRLGAGSASAPCGSGRGLEAVRFICSTVAFPAPVHNNSANADPPLQEAASPQMWWSGCLQR